MTNITLYNSHNLAIKIKEQAKIKNVVIKDMLIECSLGSNTMSAMYHGKSIAFDSLARIADYLDCSIDYLLGRTDFSNTETSDEEKLINNFRSLNEEGQNFIIQIMDFAQTKYGNKPSQENISSSDYAEIAAEGGSITRGPIRKKPETTL